MIRISLAALMLLSITVAQAQQRADSLMLSVYHLGSKYRLTPSVFGAHVAAEDLLGEMVRAYDTLLIPAPFGLNEAAGESLTGWKVQHDCEKISSNLKDKVVIMDLYSKCDPTFVCLKIQREGAKAVVLVHSINNRDSIELKGGLYADSIKIPCFTVRRDIGVLMTTQLPALVGIKKPDVMPDDAMALKSNPLANGNTPLQAQNEKAKVETQTNSDEQQTKVNEKNNIQQSTANLIIHPNPTSNNAQLIYELETISDVNVEVINEVGQIIETKTLKNAQFGTLSLECQHWSNGMYIVKISNKEINEIRKLVVQH